MYKVYKVDKCFDSYATDEFFVGAESVEDVINHLKELYPDSKHVVHKEDWMDEYDWEDETEFGKYKEGDVIVTQYFTEEQMNEFKESLDPNNHWPRIRVIPHLFTDTPYDIITSFGYYE